jgi:hypothetical protein
MDIMDAVDKRDVMDAVGGGRKNLEFRIMNVKVTTKKGGREDRGRKT